MAEGVVMLVRLRGPDLGLNRKGNEKVRKTTKHLRRSDETVGRAE
jgi:hypothetical protein